MSSLLVQELQDELIQEFRLTLATRYNIGAFIPYLYMHNAPAGTFKFEIIKNSVTIYELDFTCDDIKDAIESVNNYAHVFLPFVPQYPIFMEAGIFYAKLTATGYSPNFNSFLGWVQQYENNQNPTEYEIIEDIDYPLAMRIKLFKEGIYI